MFIVNLEIPGSRRNHSLTSKCRFRNLKIHDVLSPRVQACVSRVLNLFPLFLDDLDKKYKNEIKWIKYNSIIYMEYNF